MALFAKGRRIKLLAFVSGSLLAIETVLLSIVFIAKLHTESHGDDGKEPDVSCAENQSLDGRVVIWTPYFGSDDYLSLGIHNSTFEPCPYKCEFVVRPTAGQFKLRKRDAVVFHIRDVANWTQLPPQNTRHPDQLYVFMLQECPLFTTTWTNLTLGDFGNVFNVTMTYRRDSDVYYPYGVIKERKERSTGVYSSATALAKLASRPNLAAIIVSHCNTSSNRESFISDLQDYVPVDVYGGCGELRCKVGHLHHCLTHSCKVEKARICYKRQLSKTYKFYLSLENSLCHDYVSEKFFFALKYDMVPVVYSGADLTKMAPPHSYINALDFKSPKELAEYLLHLDMNREKYLRYFEWKRNYTVDMTQRDSWCDLCARVKLEVRLPAYEDIYSWWNYKPGAPGAEICHKPARYKHNRWRDEKFNELMR